MGMPFVWDRRYDYDGCTFTLSIGTVGGPALIAKTSTRPTIELSAEELERLEVGGSYVYRASVTLPDGRTRDQGGPFVVRPRSIP